MKTTLSEMLIPLIVALVTSVTTYLVARNSNNKDIVVANRQSLSEDERNFRLELKEEIKNYRDEIELLRIEMSQLRIQNVELIIDNKRLIIEVEELRQELASLKKL